MNKLKQMFERASKTLDYALHGVILSFTEKMTGIMESKGITKSDLAARIGCSAPYVTKIFRGNPNLTVESMVKIAAAVGYEIEIELREKASHGSTTNLTTTSQPMFNICDVEFTHRSVMVSTKSRQPAELAKNELALAA